MDDKNSNFKKAVRRAEAGEYPEYWLQMYIKDNYRKLGFDSIQGPFSTGYDFKGVYKGKPVTVEAERHAQNFIHHKHNVSEVDILIVLNDDMIVVPNEIIESLPAIVIKVDAKDFIKETHEARKEYAIQKKEEWNTFLNLYPLKQIEHAFSVLWHLLAEEDPIEGTPEHEAFEKALMHTTADYLNHYNVDLSQKQKLEPFFTRIELLANDLGKSRRQFNDLTNEEKDFLLDWLEILRMHFTCVL